MFATLFVRVSLNSRFFVNREIREISMLRKFHVIQYKQTMENIELVIEVPVGRKCLNIVFSCCQTALQTTKVRSTLFKAECSHNKFRAVKDHAEKKNRKKLLSRPVHVYRQIEYKDAINEKSSDTEKNQCTKEIPNLCFETFELPRFIKKNFGPFFNVVSNLNQRFTFTLRSLLFLQTAKVESRDNKTVNIFTF